MGTGINSKEAIEGWIKRSVTFQGGDNEKKMIYRQGRIEKYRREISSSRRIAKNPNKPLGHFACLRPVLSSMNPSAVNMTTGGYKIEQISSNK